MKSIRSSLLFTLLGTWLVSITPPASFAKTNLPIISHYDDAANAALWKDVGKKDVPERLIEKVAIEDPSKAYQAPYPHVFLQNERMVVCNDRCDTTQNLIVRQMQDGFDVALPSSNRRTVEQMRSTIHQATVYYWVNRLFDHMEKLGYQPKHRLVVRVDRDVADPVTDIEMTNNAFFNDLDWSLSFLPSESNLLTKLMGMKMRSSAFDPSVAMHEATHSVFEDLIGEIFNEEIYGLHEAFADYFALSVLDSPKLGLVMGSGKPMRVADKTLQYKAEMEAHSLGNVVVAALYQIRGFFADKLEADRIALETIKIISKNPYALASDVVAAHQDAFTRFASEGTRADTNLAAEMTKIWTASKLTNTSHVVDNTVVRDRGITPRDRYGSNRIVIEMPAEVTREFGIKSSVTQVGLIETLPAATKGFSWYLVELNKTTASARYWILANLEKSTLMAAFDETFNLINPDLTQAYAELTEISAILPQLISWASDYGRSLSRLKFNGADLSEIYKFARRGEVSSTQVELHGAKFPARIHSRKLKLHGISVVLGAVSKSLRKQLKDMHSFEFITIANKDAARFAPKGMLMEYARGESLVGFNVQFRSGMNLKIQMNEIR